MLRGAGATPAAKRTQGARRPHVELRNHGHTRGPTPCKDVERRTGAPRSSARRRGRAGVRERGMRAWGFARNLGGPDVSSYERTGHPVSVSTPVGSWRSTPTGANERARLVPPSEGNEARRKGRQEVGALHCTCEAGEPSRGTRRRERGAGQRNRWRERCRGNRAPSASPRNCSG